MMRAQAGGRGGTDRKQDLHNRPNSACQCRVLEGSTHSFQERLDSQGFRADLQTAAGSRCDEAGPGKPAEAGALNTVIGFAFNETLLLSFSLQAEQVLCRKGEPVMPRNQLQPLAGGR